jgi:hypothetical protein
MRASPQWPSRHSSLALACILGIVGCQNTVNTLTASRVSATDLRTNCERYQGSLVQITATADRPNPNNFLFLDWSNDREQAVFCMPKATDPLLRNIVAHQRVSVRGICQCHPTSVQIANCEVVEVLSW